MVIEFPRTKQKSIENKGTDGKEAEKFFKGFCEIVKKEPLLDLLGHGVVGYSSTGNSWLEFL